MPDDVFKAAENIFITYRHTKRLTHLLYPTLPPSLHVINV